MRKPRIWVPTRSDTNQPVQSQKQARDLHFRILEEEVLYYPCSENKGADQLRGYREAGLRLCFRICKNVGFLMHRLKSNHELYDEMPTHVFTEYKAMDDSEVL